MRTAPLRPHQARPSSAGGGLTFVVMKSQVRVEIVGRNQFWRQAVLVEWEYQFPARKLVAEAGGFYRIESAWLEDLRRVASQCFSQVLLPPEDPARRQLFRRLVPRGDE